MASDRHGRAGLSDGWLALPRWARDAAPALVVLPGAFLPPTRTFVDDVGPQWQWPTATAVGLVVAAGILVALRRRFPRTAAAAAIAITLMALVVDQAATSSFAALLVVVFSVARHTDRRTGVVVGSVAAVLVGAAAAMFLPRAWGDVRPFVQVAAMIGFAGAAGDASRSRRAYIDTIIERARRAEETKESEARSRVAEERLAIARDLHDVMAHQIAVINLHAGAASQALRTRPEDAERSLGTIREASRTVLGEIGSLLNVLRTAGPTGQDQASVMAPVPGLAELDRLVGDFARGGLRVEVRTVGTPIELPEAVDLVAYRVVQEGLTNAQKHGSDGSALLQLEYDQEVLDLTVTNTVAKMPVPDGHSAGHGLTGARERVAAVHGTVDATFGPGPVHRLTARLPLGTS